MPDGRRPEAEWGFDPALLADLELVTARAGYQLRRLEMDEPQDISGLVAEVWIQAARCGFSPPLPRSRVGTRSLLRSILLIWTGFRPSHVPRNSGYVRPRHRHPHAQAQADGLQVAQDHSRHAPAMLSECERRAQEKVVRG